MLIASILYTVPIFVSAAEYRTLSYAFCSIHLAAHKSQNTTLILFPVRITWMLSSAQLSSHRRHHSSQDPIGIRPSSLACRPRTNGTNPAKAACIHATMHFARSCSCALCHVMCAAGEEEEGRGETASQGNQNPKAQPSCCIVSHANASFFDPASNSGQPPYPAAFVSIAQDLF